VPRILEVYWRAPGLSRKPLAPRRTGVGFVCLFPFRCKRFIVRAGLRLGLEIGASCNIARMKKVKSAKRRSAAKSTRAPKNVDEYLASVPEPARGTLNKIRAAIRSAVPLEATEGISYGIPTFNYKGPLVWFAAFSNHCSLFPSAAVIEEFKDELKEFPTDKPLPTALVKNLVKARIAQNESKKPR
jgi:uncharacterized protein YdhG (YjbR/CyaY superfamily)